MAMKCDSAPSRLCFDKSRPMARRYRCSSPDTMSVERFGKRVPPGNHSPGESQRRRSVHMAGRWIVALLFCHSRIGLNSDSKGVIAMGARSRWFFLASLVPAVLLGGVFAVVQA